MVDMMMPKPCRLAAFLFAEKFRRGLACIRNNPIVREAPVFYLKLTR